MISPFQSIFETEFLAQSYLQKVYEMLTQKILEIANQEQQPLSKVKTAELSATITLNNGQTRSIEPIEFLNHGRSDGALDTLFEQIR